MTPELDEMRRFLLKGNEDVQFLLKRDGDNLVIINRGDIMKRSLDYYRKKNHIYYLVFYTAGLRVLIDNKYHPEDREVCKFLKADPYPYNTTRTNW